MSPLQKRAVLLIFALTFAVTLSLALFILNRPAATPSKPATGRWSDVPRNNSPIGNETDRFTKILFEIPGADETRSLTYYWYSPADRLGESLPLVLVLHGAPGNAYAAAYLLNDYLRRKYPAHILVPVLSETDTWARPGFSNRRERVTDVMLLVDTLLAERNIDDQRLYIIGCSEGGYGTFGTILRYPGVFAAAAALSGGWDESDASRLTDIPLWVAHGAKDTAIPVDRSRLVAEKIDHLGGDITYTEHADMGHKCVDPALYGEDLWSWMFAKTL